jgi:HSP20 family protein
MCFLAQSAIMAVIFQWHLLCYNEGKDLTIKKQEDIKMLAKINRRFVPAYWDDFFNDTFFTNGHHYGSGGSSPAVNVAEDEKEYRIEVALPGLSRKDVRIDLENDVLTISSEQKEKKADHKSNYVRQEFRHAAFNRSFELPETVDQNNIEAKHEAGVLTIQLPKKEEVLQKAPKQIEIK